MFASKKFESTSLFKMLSKEGGLDNEHKQEMGLSEKGVRALPPSPPIRLLHLKQDPREKEHEI